MLPYLGWSEKGKKVKAGGNVEEYKGGLVTVLSFESILFLQLRCGGL